MITPIKRGDMTGEDIRALVGDAPFIVEVGANDGESTAMFLRAMPKATVLGFEPNPDAIEDFHAHKFTDRVVLVECAIGDRFASMPFYCSGGIQDCNNPKKEWHKSGSLNVPKEHLKRSPEITFKRTIHVPVRPLDSFIDQMQLPVDFLWVDVQGGEPLVILGGQKVLRQTKYAIFEYYDQELYERQADIRGLLSFLPDFDYVCDHGENALFKNKHL